jgi:hypothetical protein
LPAIVNVALRLALPFDVTETVAVPEPVPLPLTVAHDAPDDDQLQPAWVVTVTVAEPEADWNERAVGDTL